MNKPSPNQLADAFWAGVGSGLACGHAGLTAEESHRALSKVYVDLLQKLERERKPYNHTISLTLDDRVEAIR